MSGEKNSCIFEKNSLITFARGDKNGKKGGRCATGNFNANSAGEKEWIVARMRQGLRALNAKSLMILMKVAV